MTANPHIFLQTAYQHVFTNLSLVSYTTVCSYHSLKENCVNATELPFNTLQNFVCCLAIYRLCSGIFFGWMKLRRKIALYSSELSLDTPWNFMRTFSRIIVKKSREQRTKFTHFACITFAQYCTQKALSCLYFRKTKSEGHIVSDLFAPAQLQSDIHVYVLAVSVVAPFQTKFLSTAFKQWRSSAMEMS